MFTQTAVLQHRVNGSFIQKLTLKEAATKTGGFSSAVQFMWTTIGFSKKLSVDFIPTAHIHVVLSRKTPLQQQFFRELL